MSFYVSGGAAVLGPGCVGHRTVLLDAATPCQVFTLYFFFSNQAQIQEISFKKSHMYRDAHLLRTQ